MSVESTPWGGQQGRRGETVRGRGARRGHSPYAHIVVPNPAVAHHNQPAWGGDQLNAVRGSPARRPTRPPRTTGNPDMTNNGQWYHAAGSLLSQSCPNATATGGYLGPSA